ncbi:MAG TPA: hypothetical protein VG225_13860 [Terracidiphilus sp.]|jgi:predicted DNA-binding mobile mystery protein A|nr:hypothetical protein [Terracidiphilus sp.]
MRAFLREVAEMQMDKDLHPFYKARTVVPPQDGWLRELRHVGGVPLEDIARRLHTTRFGVMRLERAEKAGTISLKALRRMAGALDCDVVYAVVPRTRTLVSRAAEMTERKLWKKRIRRKF